MSLIGYLHFRSVDAHRYPIYEIDNKYFYMYKDKRYKINIPTNFYKKFIDVTLSDSMGYEKYAKEKNEKGFPKVYKINGLEVINRGDIELPQNF